MISAETFILAIDKSSSFACHELPIFPPSLMFKESADKLLLVREPTVKQNNSPLQAIDAVKIRTLITFKNLSINPLFS